MRKVLLIFLFGLYSCSNDSYKVIDTKLGNTIEKTSGNKQIRLYLSW